MRRRPEENNREEVPGREATDLEAVSWARECVERGAGEILLTSIDRDGARSGYDLELTAAVSSAVHVPVVAAGRSPDVVPYWGIAPIRGPVYQGSAMVVWDLGAAGLRS